MMTRLSIVTLYLACPKALMSTSERLKTRFWEVVQRTNSDQHILMMLKISLIRHSKMSLLNSNCVWMDLLSGRQDEGSLCRMCRRAGSALSETDCKLSNSSLSSKSLAARGRQWQWKTLVKRYTVILSRKTIQLVKRRSEVGARQVWPLKALQLITIEKQLDVKPQQRPQKPLLMTTTIPKSTSNVSQSDSLHSKEAPENSNYEAKLKDR